MIAHPVTPAAVEFGRTVLVGDFGGTRLRTLFRELTRTDVTLSYVDDRTRLLAATVALRPIAVLLPVRDADGVTCAPLAERLATEAPDIRVVTLWHPDRDRDQLVDAIRAGSELCAVSSAADIVHCVTSLRASGALASAELDAIRALLAGIEPSTLVELLLTAVRSAHRGLTVGGFAEMVGYSRRTLGRQCLQAGWPPPEELLDWARVLRASLIQWRDQSTLVALAHAAGFTGPPALRRAVDHLLGEAAVLPLALTPLAVSAALRRRLINE
jgi:hypothetical protein